MSADLRAYIFWADDLDHDPARRAPYELLGFDLLGPRAAALTLDATEQAWIERQRQEWPMRQAEYRMLRLFDRVFHGS